MEYATALNPGLVCIVYLSDLVLFIFTVSTVQHGRQFHWLLGLCALHQTGMLCKQFHSAIPAWSQRRRHSGGLDLVCGLQPSVI